MVQADALVTEVKRHGPFMRVTLRAPKTARGLSPGRLALADLGGYLRTPLLPAQLEDEAFDVLVAPDHKLAGSRLDSYVDLIGPVGRGYEVPEEAHRCPHRAAAAVQRSFTTRICCPGWRRRTDRWSPTPRDSLAWPPPLLHHRSPLRTIRAAAVAARSATGSPDHLCPPRRLWRYSQRRGRTETPARRCKRDSDRRSCVARPWLPGAHCPRPVNTKLSRSKKASWSPLSLWASSPGDQGALPAACRPRRPARTRGTSRKNKATYLESLRPSVELHHSRSEAERHLHVSPGISRQASDVSTLASQLICWSSGLLGNRRSQLGVLTPALFWGASHPQMPNGASPGGLLERLPENDRTMSRGNLLPTILVL